MRMNRRFRAALTVATLASFLGLTTACYGPFNLTRDLYKWNQDIKGSGQVESKWMREGVFLLLVIVPVYEFSLLIDGLVLNSVEFWTGQNPVKLTHAGEAEGGATVVHIGETVATLTTANDGASVHVTYEKAGQVIKAGELVKDGTGYRFVDETGRTLYSAEMRDTGELAVWDGRLRLTGDIPPHVLLNAEKLAATRTRLQFAAN